MKLLHTSDWHLGMAFDNLNVEEDQRHFLSEIYRIAEEEKVDGVLIAGDIYDRANPSANAVELYDEAMEELVLKRGLKVYIVAGNHDSATKLATNNRLLEKTGLVIQGKYNRSTPFYELGDCDIYMLPWMSTDRARSQFPEMKEKITKMTDAYSVVCDEMRKSFRDGRKHIIISHAFIINSETSESDRAAVIGTATAVPSDVFDGFDYVALGHIHKPQVITDTIRYSGSPMPYSFGKEESQTKSVTVIDTDTMEIKTVPLSLLHLRKTIEGTLEEIENGVYTDEIKNAYILAKITDRTAGASTKAYLKEKLFPNIVQAKGLAITKTNGNITMTPDELTGIETDYLKVFTRYCRDTLEISTDGDSKAFASLLGLLEQARTDIAEGKEE